MITGAGGFVGANLARKLLVEGHEVHALLRPAPKRWRLTGLGQRLEVHEGDVGSRTTIEAVVAEVRPQWIFHLAAYGAYPGQKGIDAMIQTNFAGAVHVADAAAAVGVEAFVNAGSSSEYGYKDHAPTEAEFVEPNSDYAVTKAAATLYLRSLAARSGLPAITLRLYSVYGPYEEPTRLVPTLIRLGLEGRLPPLVRPDIARDYVHVDDVCDAFLLAAEGAKARAGAVYNVGTGRQTSMREMVEVSSRLLSVREAPQWNSMPPRSWDTDIWVSNPALIQSELGWTARLDLEAGLRRTIAWTREADTPRPSE